MGRFRIGRAALAVLAGVLALGVSAIADAAPTVKTLGGEVSGLDLPGDVTSFRGIPYAAPPVGPLRWKSPQAAAPWTGVRDATKFGAACTQPKSPPGNIYADDPPQQSEDCLFLNIWKPAGAKKAPVMVWIHGGALVSGNLASNFYDAAPIAKRGVVVVTVNYRLGIFGFLAHPGLSAESPHHVSGNYGLLDQVQALIWVRNNIAAFSGDPDNVTIFGESAGGLSVMDLVASPMPRVLFKKAIAESAYMVWNPELNHASYSQPSAEDIGAYVGLKVGAPDIASLRARDAQSLMKAATAAGYMPMPTIDGWLLPRQIVDTFDRGEQAKVPLLVGFNAGEIRSLRVLAPPAPKTPADYEAEVRKRYRDLADAYLKLYPAADPEESVLAATRDGLYGWTAHRMALKQAAIGTPSYLYYFEHTYPLEEAKGLKSFHASEVPFVFGQVGPFSTLPAVWPKAPETAEEVALSDAMIDYWTSFARDGAPDAKGLPVWKPISDHGAYMAFRDKPVPANDLLPGSYALHEEVISRRRKEGRTYWFANVGLASPPIPGPSAKP